MASFSLKFYRHGVGEQRNSDIAISCRRPKELDTKEWTVSQKILAQVFVKDMDERYQAFKKEIERQIK